MKKIIKSLIVFICGIVFGYYICNLDIKNIFRATYKAFQVGVYTNLDAANTYALKYDNSVVIKDDELYRVYVAILKNKDNINNMSNYLNKKGINYYLKEVSIDNKNLKKEINDYESIMDTNNELVFLEVNKMIIDKYKESLWS